MMKEKSLATSDVDVLAQPGIHSFDTYQDMMDKFHCFNDIYSFRWRKTQQQGKIKIDLSDILDIMKLKRNLNWESRGRKIRGGVTLEFDGIPYCIIGREFYTCHQGPDVDRLQKARKRKLEENKLNEDPTFSIKRRTNFRTTKKKNCPATVEMLCIVKILNLQIFSDSRWTRTQAARRFHVEMTDWNFKQQFYLYLPSKIEHHGHPVIRMNYKYLSSCLKYFDTEVRKTENVETVPHQDSFSGEELEDSQLRASETESYVAEPLVVTRSLPVPKLGFQSFEERCKKWISDDDKYFIREKTADDAISNSFLFVYQSQWQRRLLSIYGNEVCFLDAGHRTCNFPLPVYFLRVKTNVCHIVVAFFLCETEDSPSIQEALSLLSAWNESWYPKTFLTDYRILQSRGIIAVFPKTNTYVSDFNREREWSNWLTQKQSYVGDSANEIMKLVRTVARSASISSYDFAIRQLQQSKYWKESMVLQSYYSTVWQPVIDKWVQGFRDESRSILVLSKVGSEKENDWIADSVIPRTCELPVIEFIENMLMNFFPTSYKKYFELNLHSSERYKNYHESVPHFLHNRPRYLIEHIMKRILKEQMLDCNDITSIHQNQFELHSQPGSNDYYSVFLGDEESLPHCSCLDWTKYKLPCKHILSLITKLDGYSWDSLCSIYSKSPFFRLDDEIFFTADETDPQICLEIIDSNLNAEVPKTEHVPSIDGDYIITIIPKREVVTLPISHKDSVLTKLNLISGRIHELDGEKLEKLDSHLDDVLTYVQSL